MRKDCGLDLFQDFTFEDITRAEPPEAKGVYVIQVRKPGFPADEILKNLESHPGLFAGEKAPKNLLKRVGRIRNIGDCPILYIGSAAGKKTLSGIFRDLTRRHPARYPLLALLHSAWELDFGWKATEDPGEMEAELRERYLNRGERSLPALVMR
jgi:hypothetical protein